VGRFALATNSLKENAGYDDYDEDDEEEEEEGEEEEVKFLKYHLTNICAM